MPTTNEFTPDCTVGKLRWSRRLLRTRHLRSLIAVDDDGERVPVVLEDVDGHLPSLPWRLDELDAVMTAFDTLPHLTATGLREQVLARDATPQSATTLRRDEQDSAVGLRAAAR
jgi:hypothetical protein